MKRIFIAGCGGMLGEAFYHQFKSEYSLKCTDKDVNENWIEHLDFRDYKEYSRAVKEYNPNYLFHLGAHTDLEFCETHIEDTYNTNTISVQYACYIANELHIPLLYISTAGIFDGEKNLYDDWDTPCPLGHYARSKYAGEVFVQQNAHIHLICRAGWMMGGGPKKDKKFIQKLMKQIKKGKKKLYIVDDKDGTPTYTHDFASNVRLLIEHELWGLYNMVCGGLTSRWEVAKELIEILGKQNEIEILPVKSDFFKKEYFAVRPASERLINRKLEILNLDIMRDWRIALREYVKDYYSDYL